MKQWKKHIRRCFVILICIGLLCGIVLGGVNLYMIRVTKDLIVISAADVPADTDCILVLGAGVRADGSPSHMLEDRLLTGISLYDEGASPKLLMSGDHGQVEYDEVNAMKDFAMEKGVPSADVFMDHAGFSTYDSMVRAKEVFGAKRVVIVSQKYHLYRALYVAQSLGLEAVGVPADLRTYRSQWSRDVRELLARAKDFVYTIKKPDPAFLGDPISLKDSGDVTNDR